MSNEATRLEETISDILWVELRHLFRDGPPSEATKKLGEVASIVMQHVRPIIDRRDFIDAAFYVFRTHEKMLEKLPDTPQPHQMAFPKAVDVRSIGLAVKPAEFPRPNSRDRTIDGLDFIDTSTSHPEQYDVFRGDVQVGYVRLRGGLFRVNCPTCTAEVVYCTTLMSHGGGFSNEKGRSIWLAIAARKITAWWELKQAEQQEWQRNSEQSSDSDLMTPDTNSAGE